MFNYSICIDDKTDYSHHGHKKKFVVLSKKVDYIGRTEIKHDNSCYL